MNSLRMRLSSKEISAISQVDGITLKRAVNLSKSAIGEWKFLQQQVKKRSTLGNQFLNTVNKIWERQITLMTPTKIHQ